jgi:glyoxylase I family protein
LRPTLVGLHHVALRVPDFDASLQFYTAGLGFDLLALWVEDSFPAAMIAIGSGTFLEIFGGAREIATSSPPLIHFAVRATDCDAALERAILAGAVLLRAPEVVVLHGEGAEYSAKIAFCLGLAGEEIEFLESVAF